jgi:hypothetical protein
MDPTTADVIQRIAGMAAMAAIVAMFMWMLVRFSK